jgi:serine phosphatase RsbU (regulator of sigma subunit)/PAS domain-containing protein/anti-sigma regulatory factor (Ser/Thr protein kinase)
MTAGKPASRAETELRSVLDAAGMGTFDFDVTTRLVVVDRRTRRAFGIGSDRPVVPVDELLAVIHPDDVPKVEQHITTAAEALGDYSVEHRVCLPDQERWLDIHGQAVQGVDDHLHIIGTIRDSTDLRSARDEVARVLEHLGEAVVSLDSESRVTYLNSRAEQLLGRDRASLLGSAGSELRALLGNRFTQPIPPSGEPVRVEDWSEPLGIWLEMRLDPHPVGSSIYLADVTERRSVQERTRRLQRIAAALASAVTSADVAEVMLEHVSRGVAADAAGMFLVDPERRELRLDAGLHEIDEKLRSRWSRLPLAASTPLNDAISSGRPQLVSDADVVSRFPHLARDVADLNASFYALLPLATAGRPLGLLALGWKDRSGLEEDELAFLVAVAAQSAQALERAQLYDQQRRIAESLQRSLLPQELPEVDHVDLGARYLAGAAGLQVGGDWYDVMPLPDGRLAFALGDVVGKGLPAAAAMGQVRYALRAYATLDPAPAAVLSSLDEFFAARDDEEIVTLIYGVLDPRDGVLVWSNAGHPPPLLVDANAPRTLSARADGTPLGVRSRRQESTLQLSPGDALLLYSDGLVESRARPVGEGLDALVRLAGEGGSDVRTADDLVGLVLAGMLGDNDAEDDATLLSVRWAGPESSGPASTRVESDEDPPHVASTKLRPEALAASSARRFVRSLLDRWQLLELSDVAELCVSELVTNAVLHARTPIQVEVRAGAGSLHVDVCDSGGGRIDLLPPEEPGESLESGRGLYIVQALSARTGVKPSRGGTCIWFELDLPPDDAATAERAGHADLD